MPETMVCMREHLGGLFCELGADERVVALDTDLAKSTTMSKFRDCYPERFFQMGIAEQSAMSVAAGLASEGKIPFYVSFAIFVTGTAWTQLRQACYGGLNVKVIGTHPGLDDGPDGASHHANEDLALSRSIPGLTVLAPGSMEELRAAIELAIATPGPFYIRVARDEVPVLQSASLPTLGKAQVIYDTGDDLAIFCEGGAMTAAYRGYCALRKRGLGVKLINLFSIKPLDRAYILSVARQVQGIVTVENHSVVAGIGGALAELLMVEGVVVPMGMVGVQDVFTESGELSHLKEKYGISGSNVTDTALRLLHN